MKVFLKNQNNNIKDKKNLWNMPNNMNIIDDLDNFTRKDLPVFDLVDKKKFMKYVKKIVTIMFMIEFLILIEF